MKTVKHSFRNVVCIRLDPGEDLLAGIEAGVKQAGIAHALILSGVGSVVSHSYHVVASSVNPPDNEFVKGKRPADIVNINGAVIGGRVHAHVVYADSSVCYGGHLEKGAEVLTFAVITVGELDESADLSGWDTVGPLA